MNVLSVRGSEIQCLWMGETSDHAGRHRWSIHVHLRGGGSARLHYDGENAQDSAAKDFDRLTAAMQGGKDDVVQAGRA